MLFKKFYENKFPPIATISSFSSFHESWYMTVCRVLHNVCKLMNVHVTGKSGVEKHMCFDTDTLYVFLRLSK